MHDCIFVILGIDRGIKREHLDISIHFEYRFVISRENHSVRSYRLVLENVITFHFSRFYLSEKIM